MRYILIILLIIFYSCSEKARRPIVVKSSSIEESVELNKKKNKEEEQGIKNYILNDSPEIYLNSTHGFWYKKVITKKNKILSPKTNDIVIFAYQIRDLNNQVIYSFSEIGKQQYKVDKQDIITGLQEGLKLMKEGEEFIFLFPSYKAFGYIGDEKKIGRNKPLIYDVKLLKINRYENN